MKKIHILLTLFLGVTVLTLVSLNNRQVPTSGHKALFQKMFPKTENEIVTLATKAIQEAKESLAKLTSGSQEQRTFATTIQAYDTIKNNFLNTSRIIGAIPMVYPQEALRTRAQEQLLLLQKAEIELFEHNHDLFTTLKRYYKEKAPSENLTETQTNFLESVMQGFTTTGLTLSPDQKKEVIELKQRITTLSITFQKNISKPHDKTLLVSGQDLQGLSENFIKNLKQTADGHYILTCDSGTYTTIMISCSVSSTREKIYKLFLDRSYPNNMDVLKDLLTCKNKLAQLLGYASGADLELCTTMAKTPECAEQFLMKLAHDIEPLETQEFKTLIQNLPSDVRLSPDGKLYPWDRTYLMEQYKKNKSTLDENLIAEYFPLENTLKELFSLYEKFFNIQFHREPIHGLWDQDLQILTIYQNNEIVGYLLLDLFARPNKFHNACHTALITPQLLTTGAIKPGVSLVLAHFARPLKNHTTLLKHDDVSTLYHEFGHALQRCSAHHPLQQFQEPW